MKRFPFVSDELLKALEELFPDKSLRGSPSLAQYAAKTGEQTVMDFLRRQNSKQSTLEGS